MSFYSPEEIDRLAKARKATTEFAKKMEHFSLEEGAKRVKNVFILLLVVALLTYFVMTVIMRIRRTTNSSRQKNLSNEVKINGNNKINDDKNQ